MADPDDYRPFSTVAPTTDDVLHLDEAIRLDEYQRRTKLYCEWKKGGQVGTPPPTYLGILVDKDRRLVVRGDDPRKRAEFGRYTIPWRMFLFMWQVRGRKGVRNRFLTRPGERGAVNGPSA